MYFGSQNTVGTHSNPSYHTFSLSEIKMCALLIVQIRAMYLIYSRGITKSWNVVGSGTVNCD